MIRIFLAFLSFLISCKTFGQLDDSVKVTYIANSGYFLETGNKNYLIDAVFSDCIGKYDCPDASILAKMINGQRPFDKVDFVLVTHNHPDHVNDSLIVEMLRKRDDFTLIVPQQVYSVMNNRIDIAI